MSFFEELKRRNVFRVAIAYVITAWLLLQLSDIVLDNIDAPTWLMKAIMLLLAIGLPLALVFAWAFELTPEGLKKEKDVDRTQSIAHQTGHKLDRTIIVILALALGYFAWDKFSTPQDVIPANAGIQTEGSETASAEGLAADGAANQAKAQQKSLAVLPFVDMSPAKDNEYFTDGLTEELLNILAQIKGLQVAGRTSSFAFKGKTEDLREIGGKLNVNTLLEGSVRKDDQRQRIRVTVQLINVADGYHIWSDTYDRNLEDIFAIQEDIAQQVAEALKINLLGEEVSEIAVTTRTGMNAYDLYLQGLKDLNLYTFESLRRAEKLLEQSLAIDPNYLPTRLALVRTWIDMAGTGAIPAPEAVKKASPVLEEILRAEPANSAALIFLGQVQLLNEDKKAARRSFEQSLAANPRDAMGLKEYGSLLFNTGDTEEGLSYLRQAASIEPYDVQMQWELCVVHAFTGDEAGAARECNRIGDIQAGNPMQFYGQGYLYLFKGELANYMYWNSKAIELDPADHELKAGIALAWIDLGDMQQAELWLQKAAQLAPDQPTTVSTRIEVLLQNEQVQQALDLAQKAHDEDLPDRQGSGEIIYGLLVGDAIHRHDFDRALELLQERMPTGVASPLELDEPDDVTLLAGMAQVMKMQDPASEQATALLDHAAALNRQSDNRKIPFESGFRQAAIESARGNKQAAIAGLQAAFDAGWRLGWQDVLRNDWRFESLHKELDYKNLVVMLEKDMEKQREEAYELLGLSR
ncbi:MAG TPA: hypothetical protein VI566_00035 [Xanthomonadales bacterium]|nr:hypothetical protein [Xanthomonadales bacterium]